VNAEGPILFLIEDMHSLVMTVAGQ
jgi:hypothetical protein